MSKHDTFVKNVLGLTRCKTLKRALSGWEVRRIIELADSDWATCELCGTNFRSGALIRHVKTGATLTVGGTCVQTVQRAGFPPRFPMKNTERSVQATLVARYRNVVDPGAWVTWIVEHAPSRLAPFVADLAFVGAVRQKSHLAALIKFHDARRRFERDALLENPSEIEREVKKQIPRLITINEARRWARRVSKGYLHHVLENRRKRYFRRHLDPLLEGKLREAWRELDVAARRSVVALAALSDDLEEGAVLCSKSLAAQWPDELAPNRFAWHPSQGLVWLDDAREGKAHALTWSTHFRRGALFAVSYGYWRAVSPKSAESVDALERRAFGLLPAWLEPIL
jgi:hypothetical protein